MLRQRKRRTGPVARLLFGARNRRLRPRAETVTTAASEGPSTETMRSAKPKGASGDSPRAKPADVPQPAAEPAAKKARRSLRDLGTWLLSVLLFVVKAVVVLVLLCGAGAGGYVAYRHVAATEVFDVKTVHVFGTERARPDEVRRLVGFVTGETVFSVDLGEVEAQARRHPWVKAVRAYRELPDAVGIEVTEHTPRALLLLGHLYLVSDEGEVFKRAEADEGRGLPVISGVGRMRFLNRPDAVRPVIGRALAALERYGSRPRPPVSEVNIGEAGEVTLYWRKNAAAIRFGAELTDKKLVKLDTIYAALGPKADSVRVVYLDNETRHDRVTVRLGP